jgi:hypothetical protein
MHLSAMPRSRSALNQLVEQPPSSFDSHIYADRALQQFNAEDPSVAARMNARRIAQLIPETERRGARVLLFELPYSEQLESSRSAKLTHEIIHSQFPNPDRWTQEGICAGRMAFIWMSGPP